jgi:uncharacterized Zn finger protein (UPF0148 family)
MSSHLVVTSLESLGTVMLSLSCESCSMHLQTQISPHGAGVHCPYCGTPLSIERSTPDPRPQRALSAGGQRCSKQV